MDQLGEGGNYFISYTLIQGIHLQHINLCTKINK